MHRRHSISPEFSDHYHDLGIPSLKMHDSACNLILSVDMCTKTRYKAACEPRMAAQMMLRPSRYNSKVGDAAARRWAAIPLDPQALDFFARLIITSPSQLFLKTTVFTTQLSR